MVLCKFFQQGNCRFGAKCVNEHFDVKQILKTDIESAINGKQWPLSCYGPFKDKACLPNYINDQSFEEQRYLCYESKKGNFFDQYNMQFQREILDATSKMKAMLHFTPAIVDVVTKVYDTPIEEVSSSTPANPFSLPSVNSGASTTNTAAGGMFGNSTSANNIFGGSNSNPSTNIFQMAAGAQQQTSIFGGQQQTIQSANSIFGGGNTTQPPSSIFQQAQQPVTGAGGIFAQAVQQAQTPFGGMQMTSNIFSQQNQQQQQQQHSMINSGNIFASQPVATTQMSFFGGTAQNAAAPNGGNIFAQAVAQQQPQNTNIFSQAVQQFGQPQTQAPPGGFFQQSMQQQLPPQQQQIHHAPSATYSRMEDLTAEEIEAFAGDAFMPGKLPSVPPPRELVS